MSGGKNYEFMYKYEKNYWFFYFFINFNIYINQTGAGALQSISQIVLKTFGIEFIKTKGLRIWKGELCSSVSCWISIFLDPIENTIKKKLSKTKDATDSITDSPIWSGWWEG